MEFTKTVEAPWSNSWFDSEKIEFSDINIDELLDIQLLDI